MKFFLFVTIFCTVMAKSSGGSDDSGKIEVVDLIKVSDDNWKSWDDSMFMNNSTHSNHNHTSDPTPTFDSFPTDYVTGDNTNSANTNKNGDKTMNMMMLFLLFLMIF